MPKREREGGVLYPGHMVKLEPICSGQLPLMWGLLMWVVEGPALGSTKEITFLKSIIIFQYVYIPYLILFTLSTIITFIAQLHDF